MNVLKTRTRTGLAFATILLVLAGCDSGPDSTTLLANATAAQDRGDPRAAVIELKNLLQAEPESTRTRKSGKVRLPSGQRQCLHALARQQREISLEWKLA